MVGGGEDHHFWRIMRRWPRATILLVSCLFFIPIALNPNGAWRDAWFMFGRETVEACVTDIHYSPRDADTRFTAAIQRPDASNATDIVALYQDWREIERTEGVTEAEINPLGHVRLVGTRFHPFSISALLTVTFLGFAGWFGVAAWSLHRRHRRRDFARFGTHMEARVIQIVPIPEGDEAWVSGQPESWVCYDYRVNGKIHAHRHRIRDDASHAVPDTLRISYDPTNPKRHVILTEL